jgi:formylglycine-generating enzyme required for sulfatase activity
MGKTITQSDSSRWRPATSMLKTLESSAVAAWTRPIQQRSVGFASGVELEFMECKPSTSVARYSDPDEHHGEWVHTRGTHDFTLPTWFAMSKYLVTNSLYFQFVADAGYDDGSLWAVSAPSRARLVTQDGRSLGPAIWPSATSWPEGRANHPVTGICYYEAQAFVEWCNRVAAETAGDVIALPEENLWEFAARGESGLTYPWGDAFEADKCNCAEQKIGGTSRVDQFVLGASPFGCCDMAGNAWEFVLASDIGPEWCAMRGGSYVNTRSEVRAYLRLTGVPRWHRAPDFGLRLMLTAPQARS